MVKKLFLKILQNKYTYKAFSAQYISYKNIIYISKKLAIKHIF